MKLPILSKMKGLGLSRNFFKGEREKTRVSLEREPNMQKGLGDTIDLHRLQHADPLDFFKDIVDRSFRDKKERYGCPVCENLLRGVDL